MRDWPEVGGRATGKQPERQKAEGGCAPLLPGWGNFLKLLLVKLGVELLLELC